MECPCGKPGAMRMWEAPIELCGQHMREWLRSQEKQEVGAILACDPEQRDAIEIPDARRIIDRFIQYVKSSAPIGVKVRRLIKRVWG